MKRLTDKLVRIIESKFERHYLYGLEQWKNSLKDDFINQFEKLQDIYKVTSNARSIPIFYVHFRSILIEYEDTITEMGDYMVKIKYIVGENRVRYYFVRKIVNERGELEPGHPMHPHMSGGLPCLGDAQTSWDYASENTQILDLVGMMKKFLESYSDENPYHALSYYIPVTTKVHKDNIGDVEYVWEGQTKADLLFGLQANGFRLKPDMWNDMALRCFEICEAYECQMPRAVRILHYYMKIVSKVTSYLISREKIRPLYNDVTNAINSNGSFFRIRRSIYMPNDENELLKVWRDKYQPHRNGESNKYEEHIIRNPMKIDTRICSDYKWNSDMALISDGSYEMLENTYPEIIDEVVKEVRKDKNEILEVINRVQYFIRVDYLKWLAEQKEKIQDEIIHYSEDGRQNSLFAKNISQE